MYAVPPVADPRRLLEEVPQDVLGRAFKVSGLPYSENLRQLSESDLERLADAARQFLVMGPAWNRPDTL